MNSEFENKYTQPLKKRRLSLDHGILINIINEDDIKTSCPMIQILASLLNKHPDNLEANEFMELMRIVKSLFSKLTEHKNMMESLCQLALNLIPIQEKFSRLDRSLDDKNYGNEILNSVLRNLHTDLGNKIKIEKIKNNDIGHRLIQSLIKHNHISNYEVILRAYVTQSIKWSPISVRTLLLLCRHAILPEKIAHVNETVSSEPLKNQLLKWVLDIPWPYNFSHIPINDLTEILSNFIFTYWCKDSSDVSKKYRFLTSDEVNFGIQNESHILDEIRPLCPSDINKCHLSLGFEVDLFSDLKKETNTEKLEAKQSNLIYKKSDLEFLIPELSKLLQEEITVSNIATIVYKTMIVARATSVLIQICKEENQVDFYPLYITLQNSLQKVFAFLTDIEFPRQKLVYSQELLNSLSLFFQASYDESITEGILSYVNQDSLRNLYNILAFEGNSHANKETALYTCSNINDVFNPDYQNQSQPIELPKTEILRLHVTKALKNYCILTSNSRMIEIQEQLISSLIQNNICDISSNIDIEIAIMLLEIVDQKIILSEIVFELLIQYLALLFSEFYKNQKIVRYVLRLLPNYIKHSITIGFNHEKLLLILLEIYGNLKKKMHGPLVHLEFVKCLSKLIPIDTSFTCLVQENSRTPIIELLLDFVNDPFLIVRLEVARCIFTLFSSKEVSSHWKKNFYEKLVTKMKSLEEDKTEKTDERAAKLTSFLYIISAVINSCKILQNQALFTLLHLSVTEKISIKIIQKVLKIANCSLEDNLDYLLIHWCSKQPLKSFPWSLIGTSSEFYFITCMHIPILTRNINLIEAMEICERLGISFEQSFKNSFATIVAWLLFFIIKGENWAEEMFSNLRNSQGEFQIVRNFDELMRETLDNVIVKLIQGLDDEDHFSQLFGVNVMLPESIPIRLKSVELDKCLKIVEEEIFKDRLIPFLVRERKDVLQKVLLSLTSNIYGRGKISKSEGQLQNQFPEQKLKTFHQYVYFCTLLMRELKNYYFDEMWIFVTRDICYTLLNLIKENSLSDNSSSDNTPLDDTNLSELACKFLDEFLSQILPERSAAIKEIFVLIVRTLIPLASSDESSIALQTLRFLIVEQKEVLSDLIQKLNSFPLSLQFKEIRDIHESLKRKYTLESEIEHFLTVTDEINLSSNVSSLLLLKGKLLENREELNHMYRKLENMRGFAEDCASSILHQLIYRLLKLTESSDLIISQEAAKCLGILGPGDLMTMILHPEKVEIKEDSDRIEMLTYKILTLLSNYIIEKDIDLRKASSDALYAVISSPNGQKLMNLNYLRYFEKSLDSSEPRLCVDRIRPFIVKSNFVNNKITIDKIKYQEIIDPDNLLWKGPSNCSYFEWITELSCKIAKCFGNFYLESLIPIFKMNLLFCEVVLPRIINIMICLNCFEFCDCINRFFRYNFGTGEEGLHKSVIRNQDSVRCMLNIVNFLRIQANDSVKLKFDYLPIAKAAQFCSAYFTSVLYVELWCESFLNGKRDIERTLIIDRIYNKDEIQGKIVKDILREASIKIGDPDGVFGCGTAHLRDREARLQYFTDLQQWNQMVNLQDSKLSNGYHSINGEYSLILFILIAIFENSGNVQYYTYRNAECLK